MVYDFSGEPDPVRLVEFLCREGWVVVGRRAGLYERLQRVVGDRVVGPSLVVPTDRSASDFGLLWAAAERVLQEWDPGSVALGSRM